jgi:hypothetical protein
MLAKQEDADIGPQPQYEQQEMHIDQAGID